MLKILIATHGEFANGIKKASELICGKQDNIYTLCAYLDEDFDLKKCIDDFLSKLDKNDTLIVVTDLFGGSVNNEFMNYLHLNNLHLVVGINLPLILELILINETNNLDSKIREAINNAKEGIRYCNDLVDLVDNAHDDCF